MTFRPRDGGRPVRAALAALLPVLLGAGALAGRLARRRVLLALERGRSQDYAEDAARAELALVDETAPDADRVYAVAEGALRRRSDLGPPALPLEVHVRAFAEKLRDGTLEDARADAEVSNGPLSGEGGRWVLSLLEPGVRFRAAGRRWRLELRRPRLALPAALTFEEAKAELDPRTGLQTGRAARVRVVPAGPGAAAREVLVSRAEPLQAGSFAFTPGGFSPDGEVLYLEAAADPAGPAICLALALAVPAALVLVLRRRLESGRTVA